MDAVVDRGGDGVHPALLGEIRKIDREVGAWRDRAGHFDIQHDFGIGAVLAGSRLVRDAIDGHRRDGWRGDPQTLKVSVQVVGAVASAELQDPDALAGAVQSGRCV